MKTIKPRSIGWPVSGLRRRRINDKFRVVGCSGKILSFQHPGARLDQDIVAQMRELYKNENGKFPDPISNLTWSLQQSSA
jgi:hypothetical protein